MRVKRFAVAISFACAATIGVVDSTDALSARSGILIALIGAGAANAVTLDGIDGVTLRQERWEAEGFCSPAACGQMGWVHEDGFAYLTEVNYGISPVIGIETEQGGWYSTLERIDGRKFSLKSLDVRTYYFGELYRTASLPDPISLQQLDTSDRPDGVGYLDFLSQKYPSYLSKADLTYGITGYRGSRIVGQLLLSGGAVDTSLNFGSLFNRVSTIRVEIMFPEKYAYIYDSSPTTLPSDTLICYYSDWCGTMIVDRIEVTPAAIPVPAPGLLLSGALIGASMLAGFAQRRGSQL